MPNSVFVHIPRTGGLWLGEVVARLGIKHQVFRGDVDSHFTYRELPEFWRRLPAFSFVRHPLAWVKSRWSHALEHNLVEDHRHYGVHREFDELVRPTFKATVEAILEEKPGIVSHTFQRMLDGVDHVRCTEELPDAACELLANLEGISAEARQVIESVPPFNGTSRLDRYKEVNFAPDRLVHQFMLSEKVACDMWQQAKRRTQ